MTMITKADNNDNAVNGNDIDANVMVNTRAPCRGLSLTSPMNKSMSSTLSIMMVVILVP